MCVSNFRNDASALKVKPSSGTPCTVRTTENIELDCTSVLQSPERSAHTQSVALKISYTLNFHSFKIVMVQKLQRDFRSRLTLLCSRLLHLVTEANLLQVLITSNEAHFELSEIVNKQNF